MKKKFPKYLKLVVNNGKLIDQAYEIAKEQLKLIQEKQKVQATINLLKLKDSDLGERIQEFEKEIINLERKVNGTAKREPKLNNGESS